MQLSIIVPCYNGSSFIPTFLSSIKGLEHPENMDLEILIVDNGSSDNSIALLNEGVKTINKVSFKILSYTDKQSSYAVRNFAVSKSSGEILAFTDIDCVLPQNYLQHIVEVVKAESKPFITAGNVKLFLSDVPNIFEYYDFVFGFNMKSYVREQTGVTANAVIPRSTFNATQGFDEVESGGDRAFFKKTVREHNIGYNYQQDLVVHHPCRDSYIAIMKKAKRVSRGLATFYKKLSFVQKSKRVLSLFMSAFVQLHQFKVIYQKRAVIKALPFLMQIKLVLLIFWVGFYSRIYTIRRTLL